MALTRFSPLNMLLLLLVAASAVAQLQDNTSFSRQSSGEVLRNMIVVGPYVVVGSSAAVYALNSSLAQTGAVSLSTPNLLLLANYTSNAVLFCGNANCSISPVGALTSPSWSYSWSTPAASVINIASTDNIAGALASNSQGNPTLVYGEREIPSASRPSRVSLGRIVQAPASTYSYVGLQSETSTQSGRVFLTSFNYNNFVYFVFQLRSTNTYQTRVARVCGNDTGNTISGENFQRLSYYEIVLTCQAPGQSSSVVSIPTAASFLPSSSAFNYDPTILVSSVIAGNNYLCAYSLTTINNLMNQKYNSCINGVGNIGFSRSGNTPSCVMVTPQAISSTVSCD